MVWNDLTIGTFQVLMTFLGSIQFFQEIEQCEKKEYS